MVTIQTNKPQKYEKKVMHIGKLCLFVFYEFSIILYMAYNVGLLVPMQVMKMASPSQKAYMLATISTISAVLILIAGVLTGVVSDRLQTKFGRRKPFLLIATFVMIISITLRSVMPLYKGNLSLVALYAVIYFMGSIAMSSAICVYKAMTPDIIHKSQIGTVSGMIGFAYTLGYIMAISIFGMFFKSIPVYYTSSIVVAFLLLATLTTLCFFKEPEHHYSDGLACWRGQSTLESPVDLIEANENSPILGKRSASKTLLQRVKDFLLDNPLKHWNFFWVFASRFLYNFAIFAVQGYMLYFFTDAFGNNFSIFVWEKVITNPVRANSMYSLSKFLSCLVSSAICGTLSDKYGRKPFVFMSAIMVGLSALGTMFIRNYSAVLALGAVTGLGIGAHHAVDMGLASDVLPSKQNIARDMSIWQLSLTIPHLISPPIIGFFIGYCDKLFSKGTIQIPHFGYVFMFFTCAVFMVLSAIAISFLRTGKQKKSTTVDQDKQSLQEEKESPVSAMMKNIKTVKYSKA